ncbi:MAG: hypothetical protein H6507_12160 [Calditrichaeota bacterium]|nr:hypothetical protein [Calditrichota bacterium]
MKKTDENTTPKKPSGESQVKQTDSSQSDQSSEQANKFADLRITPLKIDMGRYRKFPTDGIF